MNSIRDVKMVTLADELRRLETNVDSAEVAYCEAIIRKASDADNYLTTLMKATERLNFFFKLTEDCFGSK